MMYSGLLELPAWGYVLVALALTHLTIAAVTIYLHRHQAHRALELHPAVAHAFRFWLWLTTGMVTREWVAVHRKHHAFVETADDPHSPQVLGIRKVLLQGAEVYRRAARDPQVVRRFGNGTPDDWLEHRLYARHTGAGVGSMLIVDLVLFGLPGLTIWAVQMAWIPFFAAGVINGVGHWAGYRNYEPADASRNIVPVGILIGGEELHNNHHAFASSARFASKWWELDLGWVYIRVLSALRLARVKRLAPRRYIRRHQPCVDLETVRAVASARFVVMADFARHVVRRVHREELRGAGAQCRAALRSVRRLLPREVSALDEDGRRRLEEALAASRALAVVYQYRQRLQALWSERGANHERLRQQLQDWCRQAEATGIRALADFAALLRGYALAPV